MQARHSRSCRLGRPWTTFAEATKQHGCSCSPLYHVVLRHDGKLVREPVGHNRREAQRALDARRGDIARRVYRVPNDMRFNDWGDAWLAGLAGKANTRRVYAVSINYAKRTFGRVKVRDLTPSDVRRFLDLIRDDVRDRRTRKRKPEDPPPVDVGAATLAKHLRQLGACLPTSPAPSTTDPPAHERSAHPRPGAALYPDPAQRSRRVFV